MNRIKLIFLFQCLTYCSLQSFASAKPLRGTHVKEADPEGFRFVVSLGYKSKNPPGHLHLCGGTLISRRHVLTAQHCLERQLSNGTVVIDNIKDLQLSIGSVNWKNGTKYDISSMITIERWAKLHKKTLPDIDKDIAILTLKEQVKDSKIKPATIFNDTKQSLYGKKAVTVGWGVSDKGGIPEHLLVADMKVISHFECAQNVQKILGFKIKVPKDYLCTETLPNALVQSGDSGSPLFLNGDIIGFNGSTFPRHKEDHDPDVQVVFSSILFYKDFINGVLKKK